MIRTFTIILLMVFANTALAQRDGVQSNVDSLFDHAYFISYNLYLNVHFSNFRYGSFYQQRDPTGGVSNDYPLVEDADNNFIIIYPPTQPAPFDSISFDIDTANIEIRNFYYFDNGFGKPYSLTIHFDSIPYTLDSLQHLRAIGEIGAPGSDFVYEESIFEGEPESTYYSDSYTYIDSTSYLIIDAALNIGNLIIRSQHELSGANLSVRIDSRTKDAVVDYSPASNEQTLWIYNLVGQSVLSILIPPQSAQKTIKMTELPPGIYFFRLGKEISKVMVNNH